MGACDNILDLISAALDGPLSDAEQAELDAHLAHCPACSALYQDLSALHGSVRQLDEIPAPAGFSAAVMARINAEPAQEQPDHVVPFPTKRASRSRWKAWTATAAAVAIVALGAVTLPGHLGGFKAESTADTGAPQIMMSECADIDTVKGEEDQNTSAATADTFSMPANEAAPAESFSSAKVASDAAVEDSEPEQHFMLTAGAPTPESYRGLLTFSKADLPDELEQYESFSDGDALYYIVPAEEFDALAQERNMTPEALDSTAEYGLICVTES